MDLAEQMLKTARAYSAERGVSMARLATIVMNDGKFFDRVAAGKTFTIRSYLSVMAWFVERGAIVEPVCLPPIETHSAPRGFKLSKGDQVLRVTKKGWRRYLV